MRAFQHRLDNLPISNSASEAITVHWGQLNEQPTNNVSDLVCGFNQPNGQCSEIGPEVWTLTEAGQSFRTESAVAYQAHDCCFAFISADVSDVPCLREVTEALYRNLLNIFVENGHDVPFRLWNIIPNINNLAGTDQERYKQFCIGREAAIKAVLGEEFDHYPAASAVGNHQNKLIVFGFASRMPFHRIENPRQVPAYRYPRQYGPVSPSFARAALSPDKHYLFVSGTASIVGHESLHIGNLLRQTEETIHNIRVLITEADNAADGKGWYQLTLLRVYIRDLHSHALVTELLKDEWPDAAIQVLEADICREELLVEVEALGRLQAKEQ